MSTSACTGALPCGGTSLVAHEVMSRRGSQGDSPLSGVLLLCE